MYNDDEIPKSRSLRTYEKYHLNTRPTNTFLSQHNFSGDELKHVIIYIKDMDLGLTQSHSYTKYLQNITKITDRLKTEISGIVWAHYL